MVHDFLAKFKHFKSSNLHALKGNRGLNSSMLAFREEPNHRQGSEATDPLGLLTVNGIAKDTHLKQGHCLEPRGSLMLPRFVKTSAPDNQERISVTNSTNGTFNRGRGTCGSLMVP